VDDYPRLPLIVLLKEPKLVFQAIHYSGGSVVKRLHCEREFMSSIPDRVIPKTVYEWYQMLPLKPL